MGRSARSQYTSLEPTILRQGPLLFLRRLEGETSGNGDLGHHFVQLPQTRPDSSLVSNDSMELNHRQIMSHPQQYLLHQVQPAPSNIVFNPHQTNHQPLPAAIQTQQTTRAVHRDAPTRDVSLSVPRTKRRSKTQPPSATRVRQARRALVGHGNLDECETYASYIGELTRFKHPHETRPVRSENLDPPDLPYWRDRFFNFAEPFDLTQDQYLTYYPHVDNVYSHRGTQYSRTKPFVNHYMECRLIGRPPGKSVTNTNHVGINADENAPALEDTPRRTRKRKRREPHLCDVKIKITEYLSQAEIQRVEELYAAEHTADDLPPRCLGESSSDPVDQTNDHRILESTPAYPPDHPGATGQKWYTVSRVVVLSKRRKKPSAQQQNLDDESNVESEEETNLDHQHSLSDSDRIKKNSVIRQRKAIADDERRECRRRIRLGKATTQYNRRDLNVLSLQHEIRDRFLATGIAARTVAAHGTAVMEVYGNSFCPFTQRVWITLEHLGLQYQYIELKERDYDSVTLLATLPEILDLNPEGHVPFLRHGSFFTWDPSVIIEYLEDIVGVQISIFGKLPTDPEVKAESRLWAKYIDEKIYPAFYALLFATNEDTNTDTGTQLLAHTRDQSGLHSRLTSLLLTRITHLINSTSQSSLPFFHGSEYTLPDVTIAPLMQRLPFVISNPEPGLCLSDTAAEARWKTWTDAVLARPEVRATTSLAQSYTSIYGRDGLGQGLKIPEDRIAREMSRRVSDELDQEEQRRISSQNEEQEEEQDEGEEE